MSTFNRVDRSQTTHDDLEDGHDEILVDEADGTVAGTERRSHDGEAPLVVPVLRNDLSHLPGFQGLLLASAIWKK